MTSLEPIYFICAQDVVTDSRTNMLSAMNIIEQIKVGEPSKIAIAQLYAISAIRCPPSVPQFDVRYVTWLEDPSGVAREEKANPQRFTLHSGAVLRLVLRTNFIVPIGASEGTHQLVLAARVADSEEELVRQAYPIEVKIEQPT